MTIRAAFIFAFLKLLFGLDFELKLRSEEGIKEESRRHVSQLVQTRSLTPVNKLVKELFTCAYALIAFVRTKIYFFTWRNVFLEDSRKINSTKNFSFQL